MAATADNLIDTPEQPQPFLKTEMGKKVLIGAGVAAALALIVAIWLWNQAPEYRVLYANYSDKDGGAITAALDQMGVKYKFSEGGSAILVPAEQVPDLRLKLASQGLPKGGNVGFELMENQKLGVSQFLEQVNYQQVTWFSTFYIERSGQWMGTGEVDIFDIRNVISIFNLRIEEVQTFNQNFFAWFH